MVKKVFVAISAQVRIVDTETGVELMPPELYLTGTMEDSSFLEWPDVMEALCDTAVRFDYVEHFRNRFRTEVAVKRHIGSTRWSVDVLSMAWNAGKQADTPPDEEMKIIPPDGKFSDTQLAGAAEFYYSVSANLAVTHNARLQVSARALTSNN